MGDVNLYDVVEWFVRLYLFIADNLRKSNAKVVIYQRKNLPSSRNGTIWMIERNIC
jgi:hypothetical protein